jgi:hypothetical protein
MCPGAGGEPSTDWGHLGVLLDPSPFRGRGVGAAGAGRIRHVTRFGGGRRDGAVGIGGWRNWQTS